LLRYKGVSATMSGVPMAAVYQWVLYVMYEGAGNLANFWYVYSNDGSAWSDQFQVGILQVSYSPAVVEFNSQLFCLMQGPGKSGELWYAMFTPGSSTTTAIPMTMVNGISMSAYPGATVYNDAIWAFVQGPGTNGTLYYVCYDADDGWGSSSTLLGGGSGSSGCTGTPAPVVYNNDLYVFFQGGGGDGYMYYLVNSSGQWSSSPTSLSGVRMSASAAPVVFNNDLYVVHQGVSDKGQIWYSVLSNGQWQGDQEIPSLQATGAAGAYYNYVGGVGDEGDSPAAVVFNGNLYVFYLASYDTVTICYVSFDGTSWQGARVASNSATNQPLTSNPISAFVYGGAMYIVWQESDTGGTTIGVGTGQLYYASTTDGVNWSDPTQLGMTVPSASPPGYLAKVTDWTINALTFFL
jgi:hypothetical protein